MGASFRVHNREMQEGGAWLWRVGFGSRTRDEIQFERKLAWMRWHPALEWSRLATIIKRSSGFPQPPDGGCA